MRTLRGRLILSHILPVLVILPAVGFVLAYLLETQVLVTSLSAELSHQAELIAQIAGDYPEIWSDPARAEAFVTRISSPLTSQVMLLDAQDHLLVSSDPADAPRVGQVIAVPSPNASPSSGNVQITHRQAGAQDLTDVVAPVTSSSGQVIGYVWVINPTASVFARIQQMRELTLLVLGIGLLIGVAIAWFFATNLEKSLRQTTQAVYQLANGSYSVPLPEEGPEELRLLSRAYNALLERLETLEASRRQLLANLVHELGRPLGALHAAVQALLSGADEDVALRKELLQGMDDELGRLKHLLGDLAHLHSTALGALELNYQTINLNEWVPRVLAPWREAARAKRQDWSLTLPKDLPVPEVDPDRLAQALGNLISNAIRYTPAGGKISVEVAAQDDSLDFCVSDNGPGISPSDQALIFSPFFRGRGRRFPQGMGLGLTIARDLVLAHGGQLLLDSTPGIGTQFTIRLPVNSSRREPPRPN